MVTRNDIITAIEAGTKDNPSVHALWLEGSDAHDRVDKYADIDIWLDIDDDQIEDMFTVVEDILQSLAPIEKEDRFEHPHEFIEQKCYHLEGTSPFMVVDLCIQKHSRDFWFRRGFADEKPLVIFDKSNVIRFKDMDKAEFEQSLRDRVAELKHAFHFYRFRVEKEIGRGHFLDALIYYHKYVLHPLVEVFRIKHQPTKHDFFTKHISIDLPTEAVTTLEKFFQVVSLEELKTAMNEAAEIFSATVAELEQQDHLII